MLVVLFPLTDRVITQAFGQWLQGTEGLSDGQ